MFSFQGAHGKPFRVNNKKIISRILEGFASGEWKQTATPQIVREVIQGIDNAIGIDREGVADVVDHIKGGLEEHPEEGHDFVEIAKHKVSEATGIDRVFEDTSIQGAFNFVKNAVIDEFDYFKDFRQIAANVAATVGGQTLAKAIKIELEQSGDWKPFEVTDESTLAEILARNPVSSAIKGEALRKKVSAMIPRKEYNKDDLKDPRVWQAIMSKAVYEDPDAYQSQIDQYGLDLKVDNELSNDEVLVAQDPKSGKVFVSFRGTHLDFNDEEFQNEAKKAAVNINPLDPNSLISPLGALGSTDELRDVNADKGVLFGNLNYSDRYRDALKTYQDTLEKYDGDIVLSGHSLGGSIANELALLKASRNRGVKATTFNPGAGIGDWFYGNNENLNLAIEQQKTVENLHTAEDPEAMIKSDFVSHMGRFISGKNINYVKKTAPGRTQLAYHSMDNFLPYAQVQ